MNYKSIAVICFFTSLCAAQPITISGMVKDTGGVGIVGATVKLEKADISTITGADGSFTITNDPIHVRNSISTRSTTKSVPIQLQNGKMIITIQENSMVSLSVHDFAGRLLYSCRTVYTNRTNVITFPQHVAGVYLYNITIGSESYSFKSSSFGTFSIDRNVHFTSALGKHAKTAAGIADIIFVAKDGQLNYRDSVKVSDTSGIEIKMIPNAGDVKDTDGNVYQSVRIGNQVWTVENLKTTHFNDGSPIQNVTSSTEWSDLTTAAYCYFDNDVVNVQKYGALYNWYAVNTGKLAPEGWRVPKVADCDTLRSYLIKNGYNWDETVNANKIAKSLSAKTDWISFLTLPGEIGNDLHKNNASGFSALPGGQRIGSYFSFKEQIGFWWCATEYDAAYAFDFSLAYDNVYLYSGGMDIKSCGFSIRLLRDCF